jgi:8-oxo-dGTP diphosphatase
MDSPSPRPRFLVAVVSIIEKDETILLLRRSKHKDHAPGTWETGSGTMEHGETPQEAVLREVMEETGLQVEIMGLVGAFHFYRGPLKEESVGLNFWCRYRSGMLRLSHEHDASAWVSFADVPKYDLYPDLLKTVKNVIEQATGAP